MINSKYATAIVLAMTAVLLILCCLAVVFSDTLIETFGGSGIFQQYETKLFNTDEIIDVDIIMDESLWDEFLENAISETYYQCDVKVNGVKFVDVAIRAKGNTSLNMVAASGCDRYSFKIEFDHYVKHQTCFGLDKLVLNNNYADATNMKEAVVYDMFKFLGANASLSNFAEISVNGTYWGVYTAIEAVEDSFALRNFGVEDGELYKPDSIGVGEGGAPSGAGGADLQYVDDELESYSTIWSSGVTKSSKKDHYRVINALRNINAGENLETYLDVDNVLKYMAVHSFVFNEDSFTSNMPHNYYLYESQGRLNILPWDYNLSFGAMNSVSNASKVINHPIDTPFSGTTFFDALLNNETYLERYHAYYRKLVEEYVQGGEFEKTFSRIRSQIDKLVKTDPNAFYTYNEYDSGAKMLEKTVSLRAESVLGQLNGTIPSTAAGQTGSSALINASSIDISTMGVFMGGGQSEGGGEQNPGGGEQNPPGGGNENPPGGGGTSSLSGSGSFAENAVKCELRVSYNFDLTVATKQGCVYYLSGTDSLDNGSGGITLTISMIADGTLTYTANGGPFTNYAGTGTWSSQGGNVTFTLN